MQEELQEQEQKYELPQEQVIAIKKTNKKAIIICAIFFISAAVFAAIFFKISYDQKIERQQQLLESISSAGFDQVISVYPSLTDKEEIKIVEDRLAVLLDQEITGQRNSDTDNLSALENMISQLKQISPVSIDVDTYAQTAKNIKDAKAKYDQASKDLGADDDLAAFYIFEDLISSGVLSYPDIQKSYDLCKNTLYQSYVAQASGQISNSDFTGAQNTLVFLKKYFPNDPLVQNLAFSSTNMTAYTGDVLHIFFHPIIAYPERAFNGSYMEKGEDDYMVTVSEFNKVISQLYDKGYVLVNINSLYDAEFDENGKTIKVTPKPLYLPEGKVPYILSVDDINYYEYMKKFGQVYKLVLNENGDVVTYSKDMDGNDLYSDENGIVPILDNFVKEHPDASVNNAKGCLALTGYQGVLGYRTDEPTWDGYEQEKEDALVVISRLKETGWAFASHSQGHRHSAQITLAKFKDDTDRWEGEVLSLIGPTSVYIYPFGEAVPIDGPKFDYLKQHGFAYFCTVSSNCRISWGTDYAIQPRRAIDGIALRDKRLYNLLDVPSIIDPIRPSYANWLLWAKEKGIVN